MKETLTEDLLSELMCQNGETITNYLDDIEQYATLTVPSYLDQLLSEKKLKKSTVIANSRLNATFAYQIFSGERNATKDKLLQLSFAMGSTLKETQRLLKIGNTGELYCKNRRDAIIIFCINQNMSLEESDDLLDQYQQETICKG